MKAGQGEASSDAQADSKGVRAHLANANEAITSPFFWAYLKMLKIIGDLMLHMHHWFESCPCHGKYKFGSKGGHAAARSAWHQRFGKLVKVNQCPLVGRRAPEVAVGAVDELLAEISRMSSAHILFCGDTGLMSDSHHTRLTPADRQKVLTDFELLRSHVVNIIKYKFAPWKALPRALFGLAHWDEDLARGAARRCMGLSKYVDMMPYGPLASGPCQPLRQSCSIKSCEDDADGNMVTCCKS